MPRGRKKNDASTGELALGDSVKNYRHTGAKRKNIPPAKIAAEGAVPLAPRADYHYNPHRAPGLRFDPDGTPDTLANLLAAARKRPLTEDEAKTLADALRTHEPWLEWTQKLEQDRRGFQVDPMTGASTSASELHSRGRYI